MIQIFIDNQPIETDSGKTVLQAAFENGIPIPHFCWHPELSISGNCRMCLVEIGMPKRLPDGSFESDSNGKPIITYFPKQQIACATHVSEGMHVRTSTGDVIHSQEAVMEFLLINHPLDCPICDEAGQCKLQEYAFKNSAGQSRFEEEKVHKPKRVVWGPNIMFDGERCILCSRCIRFSQEIAKQDILTFVERNDKVTIEVSKGEELNNPYSMNVIDICPVGALTSIDFRFKSRVWEMSFNNSICPGCSRGCNIRLGVRNNQILRIDPKANPYVNHFWLCDWGRLSQFPYVNNHRVLEQSIKIGGNIRNCSWDEALANASERLMKFNKEEILFIASPKATNEDNYSLLKFSKELFNQGNVAVLAHLDNDFGDDFLRKSDKTPNMAGLKAISEGLGFKFIEYDDIIAGIKDNRYKAVYLIEENLEDYPDLIELLANVDLLILHAYNHNKLTLNADVVFSTSTYAEIEGTFTNFEGRVQHFTPALVTSENIRFMGMKMSRWDKFGSHNDRWTEHESRNCRQSWRIFQGIAKNLGISWNFKSSADVFIEITDRIAPFNNMSYNKLDEFMGLKLGNALNPDPKVFIYQSHYLKPE
jgi:NADH-quinone oxidoreductase subunit G